MADPPRFLAWRILMEGCSSLFWGPGSLRSSCVGIFFSSVGELETPVVLAFFCHQKKAVWPDGTGHKIEYNVKY